MPVKELPKVKYPKYLWHAQKHRGAATTYYAETRVEGELLQVAHTLSDLQVKQANFDILAETEKQMVEALNVALKAQHDLGPLTEKVTV